MDARGLPGAGQPVELALIAGGSQNEIYEVRRGEFRCALRRPPPQPPPGTGTTTREAMA